MSLKSREARRLTAAGFAALIAVGAAAVPANADTQNQLVYNCVYPLVNGQPLTADVTTNIPTTIAAGQLTPAFDVNVVAHALGDTWSGLDTLGAASLSGTAEATATVNRPGRDPLVVTVPIKVANTDVPLDPPGAAGLTILASGTTPQITFPVAGQGSITVDALKMNIRAISASGTPIALGSASDSDGDVNSFDVGCTGPSVKLTDITVTGDNGGTTPTTPADTVAPTKPGTPTASGLTSSSANLSWTASTDNVRVAGYDVYQNGTKVQTVSGTSATLVGLSPSTTYSVYVVAKDAAGNASPASGAVSVTTPAAAPTIAKYSYALSGTSQLKTLTTGTLPVNGAVAADFNVAAGTYTGSTTLADSPASLKAIGFLPITAVVGFTEVGGTSGTLKDGNLTANTKQDIRLKSVKSLGISLVSGNCHTTTPSAIALKSTSNFLPTVGGPIAGSYDISALTGCGALNGLVSGLTAGKGNTLSLKLTPKA